MADQFTEMRQQPRSHATRRERVILELGESFGSVERPEIGRTFDLQIATPHPKVPESRVEVVGHLSQ
jgi:hypothetical protein